MPCETVDVKSPVQDLGHLEVTSKPTLSSPQAETIDASWTVKNVTDSGDGEWLKGTVTVTLDGEQIDEYTVDLTPGEPDDANRRYSPVDPGKDRKLCVTVTEGATTL
jgi:hypothetical protein